MNALGKGLTVTLMHVLLVLSLGGKLLYDRATRPRIWVQARTYDPDNPFRGRYLTLQVRVQAPWFKPEKPYAREDVRLAVEGGALVAYRAESPSQLTITNLSAPVQSSQPRDEILYLDNWIPFFIPENALGPQLRPKKGDELWAEVTIPRKGPPRPIQLAIKRNGKWEPLNYR